MTTDNGLRRWVAFNDAAGLALATDALPLLFEQKPSRSRRMAQAYACGTMLREELGADEAATLSAVAHFFFPDDTSDSYGGAMKALDGRMSKAERQHGDALLSWLRSPTRSAAHCADLRREFVREIRLSEKRDTESEKRDTDSAGLAPPQ